MSYIINVSGKQYISGKGDRIVIDRIPGEIGDIVSLDIVADLEKNAFTNAKVEAKIEAHVKGKKVIVFKKKRRQGYERKKGHRSLLTLVRVL